MPDDRLEGRHVVVTGGARGIGQGIAVRVAAAGADVTVFDIDAAGETASRIRDTGSEAFATRVDVADEPSVGSGEAAAVDRLGRIHGLVNNAGVQELFPVVETTADEWDRQLAVNARGTFLCSKAVATHMIEAGVAGSIVNIASMSAIDPHAGQGAYAASKGAVAAFTVALAEELVEHGINANVINPGAVDTPMFRRLHEEHPEGSDTAGDTGGGEIPDGAIDRLGWPVDIGHLAVLLLSDEGEWITGEALNVRGAQSG